MGLYPAQKVIVNKLLKLYKTPNYWRNNRIYLSGEMGVGKTYMGSAVIAHEIRTRPVVLVVPPTIVTKWYKVLSQYAPNAVVKTFSASKCLHDPALLLKENCINLIPNTCFNRLFEYDDDVIDSVQLNEKLKKAMGIKLKDKEKREVIKVQNYQNTLKIAPMLVYDEVHQLNHAKLDCFTALMENTKLPGLFLTGTIFNMSLGSVSRLINVTHSALFENADWDGSDILSFMDDLWQYISVSISLKQVKQHVHVKKVHQSIVPIKFVDIDDEERAFYKLAYAQLRSLGKKASVAKLGASNFLDYPQRPPEIQIKHAAGAERLRRKTYDTVAMPLMDMDLSHTKKYNALLKYLNKFGKGKRTLIYATDHSLIRSLTKQLNRDGYNAGRLPKSLSIDKYSTYINHQYKKGLSVFVVDPRQVEVGVDIDADVLVWYQLLLNMSSIIQAQRRIHRLSSKRDSKVIFLAYHLTYQEQLVDQISNAGKYNAASYGVQKHDNLTKLTHVLLEGIKN